MSTQNHKQDHKDTYLRILNPDTGRWVLSSGRKGKEVIHKYLSFVRSTALKQKGAGASTGVDVKAGNVFKFNIFYAEWCGYCKMAMPQFKKMALHHENSPNVQVQLYDVDDVSNKAIKDKHSIVFYPTITGTLGGNIHRYEGERDVNSFNKWIESLTSPA